MESNLLEMNQGNNSLGKIEIAPEVIEVIAGIAASEIEGIAQMRGNFASGVVERLGIKNHGKGVKVELTEEGVTIDVYCMVKFGVSIPSIAHQVQDNVRQTLLNMTALDVDEVNIHVVGVQFDNPAQETEIEEL
ncbi:Asp23/Gls24 family envelope stress response protein [Cytobacillus sp. Hm23]|uniref:Asp23/Gls24 family envelope stress response protein n=1 Tax=Cytobacillus sp. IB215665 TaxID=3097357 RepID=UPI002A1493B6|nr:Asp23/Gls24 family envelope stress response protein [Cytobacillus sp. IB215665]MDX8364286.1 Asp23/Gls24 family envelope stress response protein [Cytobacillus sp. IB215665]